MEEKKLWGLHQSVDCVYVFLLLGESCENKTAVLTKVLPPCKRVKTSYSVFVGGMLSLDNMLTLRELLSNGPLGIKGKSYPIVRLCHQT